jgi:hypothetical protein
MVGWNIKMIYGSRYGRYHGDAHRFETSSGEQVTFIK